MASMILILALDALSGTAAVAAETGVHNWRDAVFHASAGRGPATLVTSGQSPETLAVTSAEVQVVARWLRESQRVLVDYASSGGKTSISAIAIAATGPGRTIAVVSSLLGWLLITAIFLRGSYWKLVVGADNRYSNSKLQMTLWFGMLLTGYGAAVILRVWGSGRNLIGGVDIPPNLLMLSGLSTLSFAGAKAITQSKVDQAPPSAATPVKFSKDPPKFFDNLLKNDAGQVDLGDFQMLVVTFLAVIVYAGQMLVFLGTVQLEPSVTLPDVDTTILGAFGLGQGAYLAKKFAARVGEG